MSFNISKYIKVDSEEFSIYGVSLFTDVLHDFNSYLESKGIGYKISFFKQDYISVLEQMIEGCPYCPEIGISRHPSVLDVAEKFGIFAVYQDKPVSYLRLNPKQYDEELDIWVAVIDCSCTLPKYRGKGISRILRIFYILLCYLASISIVETNTIALESNYIMKKLDFNVISSRPSSYYPVDEILQRFLDRKYVQWLVDTFV